MVADSAEVEILIMEKNQMSLFPEDVQMEVVQELRRAPNVERPFSDKVMNSQQFKFNEWYKQRKVTIGKALEQSIPMDLSTELERQKVPRTQDDLFKLVLDEGL